MYTHVRESLCPPVHARVGSRVHMHICKITIMRAYAHGHDCACMASQQSPCTYALYKPKHTLPHTHASPRSNHREHAPCTSQNTHSHTCMHRLAAITVSMRLTHVYTCTYTSVTSPHTPCSRQHICTLHALPCRSESMYMPCSCAHKHAHAFIA
jgi:hypothetical protein